MKAKTIAATALIALAAAAFAGTAAPAAAGSAGKAHHATGKIFGADAESLGVWSAGAPAGERGE